MPAYWVKCFNAAIWDGKDDLQIEAADELAAAIAVCGVPLVPHESPIRLRAQVRRCDKPSAVQLFDTPLPPRTF
jgi:hypothetical protein